MITVIEGDITTAKVDAIVNAANPIMLGGGGVDGAIHQAAGPKLLEACRKVKLVNGIRCPTGEARITLAGNLPSKHVIHAVGPRYHVDSNPKTLLEAAYTHSLNLLLENKGQSIAFPAISCGVYGYPLLEAAHTALSVCQKDAYIGLDIIFYLYGKKSYDTWLSALEQRQSQ